MRRGKAGNWLRKSNNCKRLVSESLDLWVLTPAEIQGRTIPVELNSMRERL